MKVLLWIVLAVLAWLGLVWLGKKLLFRNWLDL